MPRRTKLSGGMLNNVSSDQVVVCVLLVVLVVLVVYYVNQNTNEGFEAEKPKLYMFYVDWCPHCKTIKTSIKIKKELNNKKINNKNVEVELVNQQKKINN